MATTVTPPPATPDFVVEERPDGIIVYHVYKISQAGTDAYFEAATKHDCEFAREGKHLRRIYWVHHTFVPTAYLFSRVNEATRLTPSNLQESIAVIVPNKVLYQIVNLFIKRLPEQHARNLSRIFLDEADALVWLEERDKQLKKAAAVS
jgi:hypothetical protein